MRRLSSATLLVAVLLFAAGLLPLMGTASDSKDVVKDVVIELPKLELHAKIVPGLVLYPKLAVPAFTEPGSSFDIRLRNGLNITKALIDDGFGHQYVLDIEVGEGAFKATVPTDAVPGLYDLILVLNDGRVVGEPHAVVVGKPEAYTNVTLVHVTDRHFGVINSNGREAANYDLAVDVIALGLPSNTLVVDTGDVADTARDLEYMQSINTDYVLDKPLVGIPGNHDHVGASPNYAKYRGLWNYTISIYGVYRIVGIDSGGDGYITVAQAKWAAEVLRNTGEPVKIVLFHHPHFTHVWGDIPHVFEAKSPDELYKILTSKKPGSNYIYAYSSWLQNRKAFYTLVKGMYEAPAKRLVVLSGHVHLDSYAEVHRADGTTINYIVTTATGGSVRPGDYHGFRIIQLTRGGDIAVLGDGPYDARHASFNLEGVKVAYVEGPAAASMMFSVTGSNITKYMVRTVVPLIVPEKYIGKKLHLMIKGLDGYRVRCTPLGCVIYAYRDAPPSEGKVYQVVLYEKPDQAPPSLKLARIYPPKPIVGRQVVVTLRVGDDAWGIADVEASLLYNGKILRLTPSRIGNTIRVIIPPLKDVDKATLLVTAIDASGKKTELRKEIVFVQPRTTSRTEQPTTTTHTGTTPQVTGTASRTTKPATVTTTTKAVETSTSIPSTVTTPAAGGSNATIIVAVVVAAALLAFLFLATRR